MTQFIIAHTSGTPVAPPPGISVRRLAPRSFLAGAAECLFPGVALHEIVAVVETDSNEANALVDALHHAIEARSSACEVPLLRFLGHLSDLGASIVCWHGSDWDELPLFDDWNSFEVAVLTDAEQQPPEVYARLCVDERES